MRRGAASQLLYVLLGLMLPIYADGGHGLDHLLGASGGYLIGMVLAAAAIGHVCEGGADRRPTRAFAAFVVGQLLIFGVGVPWLKAYTGMSWGDAIHDGFTIFIAGGIVKALIGAAALPLAWRLVSGLQGGHRR
jgi:biotin transport system substrate-specific component